MDLRSNILQSTEFLKSLFIDKSQCHWTYLREIIFCEKEKKYPVRVLFTVPNPILSKGDIFILDQVSTFLNRSKQPDFPKVQFFDIGKGRYLQELNSLNLGPVNGGGLCVHNSAYSKQIFIDHIDGSGCFHLTNKKGWKKIRRPKYNIKYISDDILEVNNELVLTVEWLETHANEWKPDWEKWSQFVALSPKGRTDWFNSQCIARFHEGAFIDLNIWKIKCCVLPSYELLNQSFAIEYLRSLLNSNISIVITDVALRNTDFDTEIVTPSDIINKYTNFDDVWIDAYIVAGFLMNIHV